MAELQDPVFSIHLNTEKGMRGGEVQCLGLVRRLEALGHRCLLAAAPDSPLLRKAEEAGVQTLSWRFRGEWDLAAAGRLRRLLRVREPVVLHAHTAHALTPALFAAVGKSRVRVVAGRRVSFPLRSRLSLLKYNRADTVVAVSGEIARSLSARGVSSEKIKVIHSGVDAGRFKDLPGRQEARAVLKLSPEIPVLGVVGALVGHKGHRVLFEALRGLEGKRKMELLLAGEGELRGELETLGGIFGLRVRFLGHLDDLRVFYAALDGLVLPSVSGEGSPGAIKEAALCGVAVIATDVSGTSEILRPGKEALIVPPSDIGKLREALQLFLSDNGLAVRLAEAARKRVELFSMERMAVAHAELYAELLSAVPKGRS